MSSFSWSPLQNASTGVPTYANFASFPSAAAAGNGALAIDLSTNILYESNGTIWQAIASPSSVNAITALTGDGTATGPGSVAFTLATVNSNVGSFGSASSVGTFTVNGKGLITAAGSTSIQIAESQVTNLVTDLAGKVSTSSLGNITDAGTDGITITGGTGAVVGTVTLSQHVADSTHNGYLSSTDWSTFNSKQSALTLGNLTDAGTDGITITGGTGAVVGSGTTISQQVADTTHNGYLSSTDWNTFNGKQASGNYITALTGDATATGPGSVALTLATVNSNTGSFGSSTAIPSFTVNGKGLITAASTNVVIAPAGTLTGTTLASNVVTSSLTSVGTITSGTWTGTTIAIANGGTGQTSKSAGFDALSPMTTSGDIIYGGASGTGTRLAKGSDGQVLTLASGIPSWASSTAGQTEPTEVFNGGLSSSVGSNLLTVNLTQADGSTNPSTGTSAVKIAFRNSTLTTGGYNERSVTGALSINTVATGATFGLLSAQTQFIYVYAIDNAGTVELALAGSKNFDESIVYSTTAIGGSSTDGNTLYSTTARTNVPIRLIGRLTSNQTTSGTYASAMTNTSILTIRARNYRSSVFVYGYAQAATNTAVATFSTTATNIGTAITYTRDATNGDKFVINEDGIYAISANIEMNNGRDFGWTKNSSTLTTGALTGGFVTGGSFTPPTLLAASRIDTSVANASNYAPCSNTVFLQAGDTLRVQVNASNSGTANQQYATVTRIGD